jgi:Ca-activated chloride channel family protein
MPTRKQAVRKSSWIITSLALTILGSVAFGQTGINDVHVKPRHSAPDAMEAGPMPTLGRSMLGVIKSEVKLVLVPVSVTDEMERLVTGLQKDNFEILEGNRPQLIQNLSSDDMPVSIGIVIDTSGSMSSKVDRLREAVTQFCKEANPQDEFFMIGFADEPYLMTDFTSSTQDVEHDLLFAQPKGRTALLDAIYLALHKMESARYNRKALLVISDGGDNHSRFTEKDVKELAKESDAMIYSIGTFDRSMPTLEEMMGPSLLAAIAEPTGGRVFTLDNLVELPSVARHIGRELRTQYVLAYHPLNPRYDGRWRKIKVKLRLPRKFAFFQAHARSGYYAAAE